MKKTYFIFLLLVLFFYKTFARVDIEFGESLNYGNYPNLSLKVKISKNFIPIEVSARQVVILEGNYPTFPTFVSKPDISGFQTITWTSTSPDSKIPVFYITVDDEVGISSPNDITPHPIYDGVASLVTFVDNDRNIIKEIRFGSVPIGEYTNQRVNIVSAIQRKRGNIGYPTIVDWVGTTSNEFKYLWLGSSINTNPPPVAIISPFPYAIELLYIPQDNKYKREYLTVSFDNGRQSHIALVANNFPIHKRTLLQLLQPKPNEILYPCQKYQIQWKGNRSNIPVTIEYTTNKGIVWEPIAEVIGNSTNWFIPNIETDSLFIRINQDFNATSEFSFSPTSNKPQKIAFNTDESKILIASKDGNLIEYNVNSKSEISKIPFAFLDYPFENANITGLDYFAQDSFAIVSYRWSDFYGNERNDTIVVVNLFEKRIVQTFALRQGERSKKFLVDKQNGVLLLVKENQNNIELYNLPNLTYLKKVTFEAPIQEIAKKNNLLAVALISNKIELLNLNNLTNINEFELKYLPFITNLAISNDGRLIAFTTKKENIKDVIENLSDAYVLDVSSGQIVRSLYNNWSDAIALDFSPTDNYLNIGFEYNPTIVVWDLVNDVVTSKIYGSGYSLSDLKVSNLNFTIATSEPGRNVIVLRGFSYPEMVVAGPFKIHKPKVVAKGITFPPQKIYYQTAQEIIDNFCNIGDVPFIIENAYFIKGKNFSLQNPINGDTIQVGSCLDLPIIYNPKDTGNFVDTLVVVSCGEKYYLPLVGRGINRDFKFLLNSIDFGAVCINESNEIELELGFNNDSLDLPIDLVRISPDGQKHFSVVEGNQYQVLTPSQKLKVKIKFQPKEIGNFSSFVEIFYLGQWEYVFRVPIKGEGFGIDISLSTYDLRFIPEIQTREVTISNLSNTDVIVDSLVFNPANYFQANITTPFNLPANSGKILSITMLQPPPTDVSLTIYSSPCSAVKTLTLGQFFGTSSLYLPRIETEPKGIISIPIEYQNSENHPYNGRRFFEAEITLNSKMFLPLSIESEFGSASITKNIILDNIRVIGFRVEGNFPNSGTLAKIIGNVALGETDSTSIDWNLSSNFWGKNVRVTTQNGLIKLIGLCGSRRVIVEENFIRDIQINPNPAKDNIDLSFVAVEGGNFTLRIFDVLGNLLYDGQIVANAGNVNHKIEISNFSNGIYKLVISKGNKAVSKEFIKI